MVGSVTTTVPSRQFAPCSLGFCDGSGWYAEAVPFGHPNFGKALACQCRIQQDAAQLAARQRERLSQFEIELGGELALCTLENYNLRRAANDKARQSMKAARDMCIDYATEPEGWIYLYGPTGVGKSHLAAATSRALANRNNLTLAYISEPQLMKYLRDGWGQRGDDSTDSRMTLLQEAGLLVIDDIGTAHRGKGERVWADETILELLMPRYQHGRFTILTSNLKLDDIEEPRIRSRIKGQTNVDQTGRQQCLMIINSDQREGSRK